MNAKAGWVAVANSGGDLLNRLVAATQKLSGFLHAKFNQVVAEAEPELFAKQARQMSAAAARDLVG